jgi:hypothetical protein
MKGAHVRVRAGVAREAGVGADVGQPQRLRLAEHHAEQAVRPGQRADPAPGRGVDAGGEEPLEPALAVGHADRGVAGAGQLARRVDHLAQHRIDPSFRTEPQHHVEQPPISTRTDVGVTGCGAAHDLMLPEPLASCTCICVRL